jgi:probable phosphoglycerate mutase
MSEGRMIYLIRHGQTEWNQAKRLQGGKDSPLTDLGRHQARAVARSLEAAPPSEVLTSPVSRAKTTASIIAGHLSIPLAEDARLSEMRFGAAEGLTLTEIDERWPGFRDEREQDKWRMRWPEGECYDDVDQRLAPLVDDQITPLLDHRDARPLAIVGHETTNMILLGRLLQQEPSLVVRIGQPNNVIYRLNGGLIDHAYLGDDILDWIPGLLQKRSDEVLHIAA